MNITDEHTDRHAVDTLTDRQKDGQIRRQTGKKTDRQTHRHRGRRTDKCTDRQKAIKTDRHIIVMYLLTLTVGAS